MVVSLSISEQLTGITLSAGPDGDLVVSTDDDHTH